MSIATKGGDGGRTSLAGGHRVSKGALRVEVYGTIDELISQLGFARAVCDHAETAALAREIQRELFAVSAAVANDGGASPLEAARVDALTEHVHSIEGLPGILGDWALPGDHAGGAALDVARTVCRRAERAAVRLHDAGESLDSNVIPYLNRLADLLWLMGRLVERDAGVDSSLRDKAQPAKRWSKAW
jgi:cob(I)alamin adenosyltransferase